MKLKRKEINGIIAELQGVTGLKDWKKAISLGRDVRVLKGIQDETDTALKSTKPEGYDELQAELTALVQKKASEIKLQEGQILMEKPLIDSVLTTWEKALEYKRLTKEYDESYKAIQNEEVEIDNHTTLTEADLPKTVGSVGMAEVLGLFMEMVKE